MDSRISPQLIRLLLDTNETRRQKRLSRLFTRKSSKNTANLPFLNDYFQGPHTHYLIWWNAEEILYFGQTKFYRWLQSHHEIWTALRIDKYEKSKLDVGEYFNTFKMDFMQQAFIWFDHKPETWIFHEWNNPHPLFTHIQNEIDKLNPKIHNMTMQYVDKVMKKTNGKRN